MSKHLHERRELSFVQLGALLATRELLHRGLMAFDGYSQRPDGNEHKFHMAVPCRLNEHCGSVGCIGGTMGMLMGLSLTGSIQFVYGKKDAPIGKLFFPPDRLNWNKISPEIAVEAIDNWLATGKPGWDSLVEND